MKKYNDLELWIVGELDVPKELEAYKERIICNDFVAWEELPRLISAVDINLAPLEDSIFNEAKSENKWVEAALIQQSCLGINECLFRLLKLCLS